MSKRFNISSFIENTLFWGFQILVLFTNGIFFTFSLVLLDSNWDNYHLAFCGDLGLILTSSLALFVFYLSFFLFTKNRLILKLMYEIKGIFNKRLLYIVLFFTLVIMYGLLILHVPNYPKDICFDSLLKGVISVLDLLLRNIFELCYNILDFLNDLFPLTILVVDLLAIIFFSCVPQMILTILIYSESCDFITSLKSEVHDKICRIYNSIPCTFLVWIILSSIISLSLISWAWLKNNDIGSKCFIPISLSILITFPVVITDGMGKTVNFIKRHFIKLLIPLYMLLKLVVIYFESHGCSVIGYCVVVMLIIMLTLYTPFKRRREENRAIRAEIKSELGM